MKPCLLAVCLAACLIASTAAPAGAQDWIHCGLQGKTVNSIAVDHFNSEELLAGAEEGLYRTTNGGASWDTLEPVLLRGIKAVAFNPYEPDFVYAMRDIGDSNDGVYKSTDGGVAWNRVLDLMCGTSLFKQDLYLYAGAVDDSGEGGVYRSTDDGATWDTLNQGLTNLDVLSLEFSICSGDCVTVYLAGAKGGIFRRVDTWSWVGPAVDARISDFGEREQDPHLYAAWGNGSWSDGVYKSTDQGETWTVRYWYIYTHTVTLNPLNRSCVYAGAIGGGVFRSTNEGGTWEEMNQGLTDLDVKELAFSANDTTWLYAGTEEGGVFRYGVGTALEEMAHRESRGADFRLEPNRPDPFQRSTMISYSLPQASHVTLVIYDVTGRPAETLVNESQQPGMHQVHWNGRDNPGSVYFYRLKAGESARARKVMIVKQSRKGSNINERRMNDRAHSTDSFVHRNGYSAVWHSLRSGALGISVQR
jgi:photosystem II stability/assembly factor-like uncharacterized protein